MEHGDILERIAIDYDDIRQLPWLERARAGCVHGFMGAR